MILKLSFLIIFTLIPQIVFAQINPSSSQETKNLFWNLKNQSGHGILFGQQAANQQGVGWQGLTEVPDMTRVNGKYPAMVGYDFLALIEQNITNEENNLRESILDAHMHGAIITISWHMNNPVYGGDFYDKRPALHRILPGASHHDVFKNKLDRISDFFKSLKDKNGNLVPVIFRPFHEHNGNWFWWSYSTASDFISIWRFTVDYLVKNKNVQNILIAYSPAKLTRNNCDSSLFGWIFGCSFQERYLFKYPGDQFVDVFGLDVYTANWSSELENLRAVSELAYKKNKIAALTETGEEKVPQSSYWTKNLLNPIKNDPIASQISYMMIWRNGSENHFFGPYPGHHSSQDFINFSNDAFVVFAK